MAEPTQDDDFLPGFPTDGPDTIRGLNGNDTLEGRGGDDKLYGDEGNDIIYGGLFGAIDAANGNDFIVGGSGNDNIFDFGGNNSLFGGLGDDLIFSGDGDDEIFGDEGSDIIVAGGGDDIVYVIDDDDISGGEGIDEVNFSFLQLSTGTKLDLRLVDFQDAGAAGSLRVLGVENLYGTWKKDIYNGSNGANFLDGASGNDVLKGGGGKDILWGGIGNDSLDGGRGNDTLKGSFGADTFVFSTKPNSRSNRDFIDGFDTTEDTIRISGRAFEGIGGKGQLSADAFVFSAFAQDEEDRILYDQTAGHLWFDADGTGTGFQPVRFAFVQPQTSISADDFVIT